MLSIQGHEVNILKAGLLDSENPNIARHAEIEIDGRLHVGDIIFSETIRSFYEAAHHLSSRLNRCILHVAACDEFTNLRVRLQNCKPIPTVIKENGLI
ncbi:MAG: DUF2851 family protein [Candidatus Poribacteria bacterium]|nr:DUF2851 family protein [Candidatus Poribacteria bacterium]